MNTGCPTGGFPPDTAEKAIDNKPAYVGKGMDLLTESSDTVTRIRFSDREIILIGTAHVSRQSVEEVGDILRSEKPDTVCVEIDAARFNTLKAKNAWENLDIFKVIKNRQGFMLLANLALSSFQRKIGLDLDIRPGDEMRIAIETAEEEGIPYVFADRDIQVTLRRAWAKTGFWGKNKLLAALLSSAFTREKISEEEIENLKKKNALEAMMNELADYLPTVKEVLIDERDRYLAVKIFNTPGKKTAAVVGAGHVPGIVRWIEKLEKGEAGSSLDDISQIPPPGRISSIIPWVVPALVLGLITAGFLRSGWNKSLSMLAGWILVNGTFSAAGALAALAHPLTILLAFAAAPVTSMNPTIGVGFFTSLFEAVLRKPRVMDFENLHDDIMSLKGFFRNRVTHILIVFALTSIGSSIGTFIALPYLTSLLAN